MWKVVCILPQYEHNLHTLALYSARNCICDTMADERRKWQPAIMLCTRSSECAGSCTYCARAACVCEQSNAPNFCYKLSVLSAGCGCVLERSSVIVRCRIICISDKAVTVCPCEINTCEQPLHGCSCQAVLHAVSNQMTTDFTIHIEIGLWRL